MNPSGNSGQTCCSAIISLIALSHYVVNYAQMVRLDPPLALHYGGRQHAILLIVMARCLIIIPVIPFLYVERLREMGGKIWPAADRYCEIGIQPFALEEYHDSARAVGTNDHGDPPSSIRTGY